MSPVRLSGDIRTTGEQECGELAATLSDGGKVGGAITEQSIAGAWKARVDPDDKMEADEDRIQKGP